MGGSIGTGIQLPDGSIEWQYTEDLPHPIDWLEHVHASWPQRITHHAIEHKDGQRVEIDCYCLEETVFQASADAVDRIANSNETSPDPPATKLKSVVKLLGVGQGPVVFGKEQPRLSGATFFVVKQLLEAGPEGLAGKEFKNGNAHKYLKTLCESSRAWENAIILAGVAGGRYSVRHE